MNAQENVIREYEDLRNEIKQKIELHNSLITFMITTVIAILAFALESENTLLFLLPFGIIIPISMRITYYRESMIKLSAYIVIFIENEMEGLKWETRNIQLVETDKYRLYDIFTISHYYEGIILSIICYILFLFNYVKDNVMSFRIIICLVISFLLVIWEAIITKRIIYFNKQKSKWINKWKYLKDNK